jgi:hypothetical protein
LKRKIHSISLWHGKPEDEEEIELKSPSRMAFNAAEICKIKNKKILPEKCPILFDQNSKKISIMNDAPAARISNLCFFQFSSCFVNL